MSLFKRNISKAIQRALERGKSVLLMGPRQTGKSTLAGLMKPDLEISFAVPSNRLHYEQNLDALQFEAEALAKDIGKMPLIAIDEVQKIPILLDLIQHLIDKKVAQFILTGSSARKMRETKANWLPGRVILFYLDPLMLSEMQEETPELETLLAFGSLPEVVTTNDDDDSWELLNTYVATYVQDEIRSEALVRDVGDFVRFLPIAATESGKLVNYNQLAQEVGVSRHTLSSYYQILEDCLIVDKVEPFTKSKKRNRLVKAPKYLFFDLGVKNAAAKEYVKHSSSEHKGQLLEQFVGIELLRIIREKSWMATLYYWRDNDGPEVDWVVKLDKKLIPVEVKWKDMPRDKDMRHLKTFLNEYDEADIGYVICRCQRPMKMAENIIALPWQQLGRVITDNINQLNIPEKE
tara:strand:+ start:12127 stop:13344 length:1218 start_codon:yes stop_codon:yes gene_type:complete